MQDRNVRTAAGFQLVAALFLGALGGWAVAGWFKFSVGLGVVIGVVVMFVFANVLLYRYGGRSTR